MTYLPRIALALCLIVLLPAALWSQIDRAKYVPEYKDPTLEAMKKRVDSLEAAQDTITRKIRETQDKLKKEEKDRKKILRFDFTGVVKPSSPDVFPPVFHFPPVAQYRTGTCWSFCATSFFESEVFRLSGKKIKLSEIHTVYYEYVEKVRYFIRQRGDYDFGEGSEDNAVVRIMKKYGMVPFDAYPGYIDDEKHDHARMSDEISAYLSYVKDNDLWDEDQVTAHVKLILNAYLGEPPAQFAYEGKTTTPPEFLRDVLRLNPDDYVSVMSTLFIPFYTQGAYDVPDNWWHDSSYYNLPLDEWYAIIVAAIDKGYTLTIGGDNSEPGWNGFEDAAIVPDFDIPREYINQDSRELRFYNHTTEDNHGLHLVGHTVIDGRDWFLIKDSGRSARWGKFEGYYFMRDDYIRLKMLTFMIHKDMLRELLGKFAQPPDKG